MANPIIHVNQHVIKKNRKLGQCEPPITVKHGKRNSYTHRARITCKGCDATVAMVLHDPVKPLHCGAVVWVEVYHGYVELEGYREDE